MADITYKDAINASRNGAYAAFISSAITGAVFIVTLSTAASTGLLGIYKNPFNVFDVALVFACGVGMLRNSRAAAVVVFIYFVLSKTYIALELETSQFAGFAMSFVFLYFYGRAIQGSFVYHKIQKTKNPDYKPAPSWMYWIGIPSGLLALLASTYSLITIGGMLPSTRVLSGGELPRTQYNQLLIDGIVSTDEVIEYFYSNALSSVLNAGNVLTDRRVITYWTDENGERQIYEFDLDDIVSVNLVERENAFNLSIYQINADDPEIWIHIFLSTQRGGDQEFIEALQARIGK